MTRYVWVSGIYTFAFPFCIQYFSAPKEYYFVYASTLVILFCLADGLDAVYDSLKERLDANGNPL